MSDYPQIRIPVVYASATMTPALMRAMLANAADEAVGILVENGYLTTPSPITVVFRLAPDGRTP